MSSAQLFLDIIILRTKIMKMIQDASLNNNLL